MLARRQEVPREPPDDRRPPDAHRRDADALKGAPPVAPIGVFFVADVVAAARVAGVGHARATVDVKIGPCRQRRPAHPRHHPRPGARPPRFGRDGRADGPRRGRRRRRGHGRGRRARGRRLGPSRGVDLEAQVGDAIAHRLRVVGVGLALEVRLETDDGAAQVARPLVGVRQVAQHHDGVAVEVEGVAPVPDGAPVFALVVRLPARRKEPPGGVLFGPRDVARTGPEGRQAALDLRLLRGRRQAPTEDAANEAPS
jgi:hypothetical protein